MFDRYHLISRWTLPGTCEQIFHLLEDIELLHRIWPALYHDVKILKEGNGEGIGKTVDVASRGFLPYSVFWNFEITEVHPYSGYKLKAWGELQGEGEWSFRQNGPNVECAYDWNVRTTKKWLQLLFFLRPFFIANHNYVMAQGEKGIRDYLLSR